MLEHFENSWLTWQRATRLTNPNYSIKQPIDPPVKLGNYYPQWFKDLKADLRNYLPGGYDQHHTARVCTGLRGINTLGWTLPAPWNLTKGQLAFHPEQLHGTCWAEKDQNGEYVWGIHLISYPWRAKMAPGFRLLIADYALDFSTEYHVFSGCVDANYKVDDQGQLGGIYWYDEPIDPQHNYFNIETVVALKKGSHIPAGTVYFVIIPVWDPDYTGINKTIPDYS